MGTLDGGDDSLAAAQQRESVHGLGVGDRAILGPAALPQERVLGPDAGVVQPGRDGVGLQGLSVLVLKNVGERPVQDPGQPSAETGRVLVGVNTLATGLEPDQADGRVVDETVENAHRVGAPANAGAHSIRQTPDEVKHLGPRLDTDDALEVTHHLGERVRAGDGADHIVGGLDVGDPVAHRLVDGILEGRAAMVHRDHLGAQQLHPSHIQCLTPRVLRTHVDDALKAHQGGHSGTCHTVLTCAGLGDDARLAHLFGQQGLAERIVDLVRAGVVEVLTLEQDAGAPGMLLKGSHECLGHVTTAIRAEAAGAGAGWSPAGLVVHQTPCWRNAGWVPAATRAATASRGRPPMTRLSPTSTTEAPTRAYSSTSCGPRTPDSATLTIPWGMRGASRAKVPRSTSRVLRFRALMPMTRAPASIARSVSASSS